MEHGCRCTYIGSSGTEDVVLRLKSSSWRGTNILHEAQLAASRTNASQIRDYR